MVESQRDVSDVRVPKSRRMGGVVCKRVVRYSLAAYLSVLPVDLTNRFYGDLKPQKKLDG